MHSIRRERRRLIAGMLCLVLLMLWKQSQVDCRSRDGDKDSGHPTCAHDEAGEQAGGLE
jgi:hypothetical protein